MPKENPPIITEEQKVQYLMEDVATLKAQLEAVFEAYAGLSAVVKMLVENTPKEEKGEIILP